ncbi:MAG TPA: dienelactone hydrolase family protein [Candidatus Acidoferrales bacterium]|nr:dienelactone hydrolase family protein [Candidatus Acidoferrales bacterium]
MWRPRESGPAALIVYSHASGGHPRQSSFLCEHLAAHGYLVAAVAHQNTGPLEERIAARVPEIRAAIDEATRSYPVDPARVGLVGWSFGGWAALATPEQDDRVSSIVALAPAGARDPLPGIIRAPLTFAWRRPVATLFLAAAEDQFIPLAHVRDVFDRAPEPKQLFVLEGADHSHFADDVPATGPSAAQAHEFTKAHALAHFDATLR